MTIYAGVYEIINKVNGHKYVGSSINLKRRLKTHRYKLSNSRHSNAHLQSAWNLYNKDNFEFRVLAILESSEILKVENLLLNTGKYIYNIATNASAPMLGKKHSEETKRIISEKSKKYSGHKQTDETKQKLRIANLGKHLSDAQKAKISKSIRERMNDEYKKKMSMALKGHIVSEETRNKISIANTGKKRSKETREKISKSCKGRIISEETRKKISEANRGEKGYWYGKKLPEETLKKMSKSKSGKNHQYYGKHLTKEHRKKISEGNKGKKTSEETRKKISDSLKKYYEDLKNLKE